MFPFFHVFGRTVGMYGVCIMLGVLLVSFLAVKKSRQCGLSPEDIYIVGAFTIGFAMVFGNMLYVFVTYSFADILQKIRILDFSFLGSGIVFYGGLIGGIIGAFLGVRIAKCEIRAVISVIVPYIPLGHAIGRIGCLLAGCCYGMEYSGPLAVHYPNSLFGIPASQGYFPIQPLEALLNVGICWMLLQQEKRGRDGYSILFSYLGMYGVFRFLLEFLRGDAHRGIYAGLSLSQWISIGLLIVSVAGMMMGRKNYKEVA